MGGYGSGRPQTRSKVEEHRLLDLFRMKRQGFLDDGIRGHWNWYSNGEQIAQIGIAVSDNVLTLDYQIRIRGAEWTPVSQSIALVHQPCNFGGKRTYGLCGGSCGNRVGKLFGAGRLFLCRECSGLTYTSKAENRTYRQLRHANKLRRALGGPIGAAHPLPVRPKGMWQTTYAAKCRKIDELEIGASLSMQNRFQSLSV